MPFVTQAHREKPDLSLPGDLCYIYYKAMVEAWKKERRWTTAHNLYKEVILGREWTNSNTQAAMELAWQVFFQRHVLPYEDEKEKDNGTI